MSLYDFLELKPAQIDGELIPAVKTWDRELDRYGVDRLLWFVFGSVVKASPAYTDPVALNPLLATLGFRTERRNFRTESDIDIGLVVPDDHNKIVLPTSDPNSLFRTARAGGHILELTRFEHSWVKRRGIDVDELQTNTPVLGIYGQIVPLEL